MTVTDPALLALGRNGANDFALESTGDVAWALMHVETPNMAMEATLFDAGGGNDAGNRNPDICAVGSQTNAQRDQFEWLGGGEDCDDGPNNGPNDACSASCTINGGGRGRPMSG